MRTLSLAESGESTGQVSIEALLAGEDVPIAESDTRFDQVIRRIVTGGWPGWLDQSEEDAAAANLHRVAAKMARPPVAKVVIVPSGLAHRRTDGVDVIPLAVLGP